MNTMTTCCEAHEDCDSVVCVMLVVMFAHGAAVLTVSREICMSEGCFTGAGGI